MNQKDLDGKPLCGRDKTPRQSFIYAPAETVRQVCDKCVNVELNLCMSQSDMTVYDVESTLNGNDCDVTNVTCWKRQVVLACDVVEGKCRPVHYDAKRRANVRNKRCS